MYPCVNYQLHTALRRGGDAIDVTARGVKPLMGCYTALGPATARLRLDLPEGTYRLRVRHDGALDEHDLRLGADRITLDSLRTTVTHVPEPLVLEEISVPEAGAWPYPRAADGHYYDAPGRVYRYGTEADFEAVKDSLRAFAREVLRDRSGDGLSVENWVGDAGRSWIYEAE